MKPGIIKRNRHRSNNRPRSSSQPSSLERGFEREGDYEERLDYRPARNRVVLQQNIDKYLNLARESMSSGDRVQAENYLQHADHFNRLLNEQKEMKQQFDQKRLQAMNSAPTVQQSNDDVVVESSENEDDSSVQQNKVSDQTEE